jgi:catechol 2,3-dioxygenase-like lactoylglutathione lyase family enzyme
MIAHASLNVNNYETAKEFYRKALSPLGYEFTEDHPEWNAGGYKEGGNTSFWIAQKEKAQGGHVAFEVKNKEAVEAFYKEALAAGAKDNGAPGYRTEYWPGYYAAFVHDGDGNNVEAVWFDYSKVEGGK